MSTPSDLINLIKSSEFWNSSYNNFDATSQEAQGFMEDNNLTFNSNIGDLIEVKVVTSFESKYNQVRKYKNISIGALKNSLNEYLPVFGAIYLINQDKIEKSKQVAAKNHDNFVLRQSEIKNENEIERQEFLKTIQNKTFGDFKNEYSKDWKAILQLEVLPNVLNLSSYEFDKYGSKKSNPNLVITGNQKTGFTFGATSFSFEDQILKFVK